MGAWRDRVVPRLADRALSTPEIDEQRAVVCAGLGGRVLEVGFGSGLNLPHLPSAVVSVSAVEPAELGWRLSAGRRASARVPVGRTGFDGQRLVEPDACYDSVLLTFTLCTVTDPALALAEARRVLRPHGVLCVLEHGLSPDARVARWQHRLDPLQRRVAGGCHLTRDVPTLVTDADFDITSLRAEPLPGPALSRPWTYGFSLTARPSDPGARGAPGDRSR